MVPSSENKTPAFSTRDMWILTAAMAALLVASAVIFGVYVFAMAAMAYGVAIVIELAFAKWRKRPIDRGWMMTPLLLVLLVPPSAPLWLVAIGSGIGVFFGKMIFGGTGRYIFSPAAVGVLFVTVSFLAEMTTSWLDPVTGTLTIMTPVWALHLGELDHSIWTLMRGEVTGSTGETFRLGILVLGFLLIGLKVINWRIPLVYIGSVFVITGIGHLLVPETFVDPVMSLFVGTLFLGAFFLATDPTTTPSSSKGLIIYGMGLGAITVIIRTFSAFPEGVIFAVIIMNAVSGLIDNWHSEMEGEPA